jgi:hypothetical protein
MHKEEGGGSPQIKVDIQRRLIAHVTMHVIAPTVIILSHSTTTIFRFFYCRDRPAVEHTWANILRRINTRCGQINLIRSVTCDTFQLFIKFNE